MTSKKTKSKSKVSQKSPQPSLLNNKWLIAGGVIIVAILGIIIIRASKAAGQFAQNCPSIINSGRRPEDSEPHIDYEACINGTVFLRKSTNGEVQTATLADAQAKGEQMYNEMIAAQAQPAPTTTPTPTTAPTTNTAPKSTANQPAQPATSANVPTTTNSSNAPNISSQNNVPATKSAFVLTLSKTIDVKPKLPTNTSNVAAVRFLLDGQQIAMIDKAPFSYSFNTTHYSNGEHTLKTTVVNKDGSIQSSNSYQIKIENNNSFWAKLLALLGF